jgi:hypothetical protein
VADWRQIQALIRKAKGSSDPTAQLAQLFEKTRDGMVAFELARLAEKAGPAEDAVRWYTAAAERFRRAEWKKKAEEALLRLGAPLPPPSANEPVSVPPLQESSAPQLFSAETREPDAATPAGEPAPVSAAPLAVGVPVAARKRTRRGRRGGRRRHQRGPAPAEALTRAAAPAGAASGAPETFPEPVEEVAEALPSRRPEPERPSAVAGWQGRGRAGEPALASRLAQLESLLRRLLVSPLYPLDEAEQAPAGPGVYLLSDSDLTASYFVESCKTLRIALGHLARGRSQRSDRHDTSLRAHMAEHLGISETRVSKYLKDHCVVRWIQLDEDAEHLAHFAVAVLRPALNSAE